MTDKSPAKPAPTPSANVKPVDAEDEDLVEFLGSLEAADGEEASDWLEFLARTDFDRVVRGARKAAPSASNVAKKPASDRN